jgi:predicted nucleic acid-binding protein
MPKVISNTSCLIALSNIDLLDVVQGCYTSISITPEVALEFGEPLPDWITIIPVKNTDKTTLINHTLDIGEASTIALALETEDPLLILDDGKAREFAKKIGLKITGTVGVLVKAEKAGLIGDLAAIISALRQNYFRIPNNIEDELFGR